MRSITTLTSKGQITIPKTIREELNLERNDRLVFTIVGDATIAVKPVKKDFLDFAGSISPKKRPENFKEVRSKTMGETTKKWAVS